MADLSSLLNPAPSSEPDLQDAHAIDQTGEHGRAKTFNLPPVETRTSFVQPSVKSPLDTLADAATSAPILSPTHPNGNIFVNLGAYNQPTAQASSRPSSSHITPPRTFDQSHPPAPTSPTFSPGLQQYHHPTSNEIRARRTSAASDTGIEALPPLRRSLPDDTLPKLSHSGLPSHFDDAATPSLPGIDATPELTHNHSDQTFNKDAPVTTQIKQPSPGPSLVAQVSNLPTAQSDQAEVKAEITDTAPELTSPSTRTLVTIPEPPTEPDDETESAALIANTKAESSPAPINDSVQSAMLNPKPTPSRKRPAPKKGTATAVKPAAKKRKVNAAESIENASSQTCLTTSNSSRTSKTPAPKNRKQESVTPQRSSSVAAEDEDDDEDDGVFCICRGPDNHTWMIACDGPCEDWFHGRCIDMTEKEGELIEKYFCPNCTEAGKGETLWKRMCRLDGCRRPARISGEKKSKYCSDEHGCEFMKRNALKQDEEQSQNGAAASDTPSITVKKGRKTNNSFQDLAVSNDNDAPASVPASAPALDSSQPSAPKDSDGMEIDTNEAQHQLRDGTLRSTELKALITGVKDISEFRKLGDPVLTPPPTAHLHDPNHNSIDNIKAEDALPALPAIEPTSHLQPPYTPLETSQLATLTYKKDQLRAQKKMLDDRDTFLTLVRERAKNVLDELKKKESIKDICGFDTRLVWSDHEFDIWRSSPEGRKTLEERKLGPPTPLIIPVELAPHLYHVTQSQVNGEELPNGNVEKNGAEQNGEGEILGKGVCQKKRCERHRAWFKLQQQDIAFAKDEVRQGMRKLDEEEKGVRDRAMIRWLEAKPGMER
ncbi:MAG: hypothetical protein Q9201_007911 [Fulgogasparrea decipioides]